MIRNRLLPHRQYGRLRRLVFVIVVVVTCAVTAYVLARGPHKAHYAVNPPIFLVQRSHGYYLEHMIHQGSDDLLLLLTFSGGGTRAAALAYGVLEVLRDIVVEIEGRQRRLLDEVDSISAVSGGSFTAGYYGLFGERIFEDFEAGFLAHDVQSDLHWRLLTPANALKMLLSPRYDRSDLVADYFDELMFEGKTFGYILVRGGPSILLNATDVTLGTQFTFDQTQFNMLCSDLMQVPVSRAAVASSAVPILFSSIVLRNYAGQCQYQPPEWIVGALYERNITSHKFHRAKREMAYLNQAARPFIHLYDGGLADNLGVRTLLGRIIQAGGIWEALQAAELINLRKLVVIVVNAQADPDDSPNLSEDTVPLTYTVQSASSVPLNQYSFETLALIKKMLKDWEQDIAQFRCAAAQLDSKIDRPHCGDIKTYLVQVSFEAERDAAERAYLQALPTTFGLEPAQVKRLRAAAKRILKNSLVFQQLMVNLKGQQSPLDADKGKH